MASAKQSAKYLAKAKRFSAKLKEKGQEASFGTLSPGVNAYDLAGAYVETGKAHVFPGEWKANFSDDVKTDDLMFFVSNEVDAEACTHMQLSGIQYARYLAKPFNPAGTALFYEVQFRAGAVIETVDSIGWNSTVSIGWNDADAIGWAA